MSWVKCGDESRARGSLRAFSGHSAREAEAVEDPPTADAATLADLGSTTRNGEPEARGATGWKRERAIVKFLRYIDVATSG